MQSCKSIIKAFDPVVFFTDSRLERRILRLKKHQAIYSQGDPADSVFYLESGRARVTVVSRRGKEATVLLLSSGDFIGEESLSGPLGPRIATARAITPCKVLKIERHVMIRVLREEHELSDHFLRFLVNRGMRAQADFVDQLFNSSEERLARILLLMAESGAPENTIPQISQETLAEMIGASRSRVNLFMSRFRQLGYIEYDGRIRVNKSLLNVINGN
jgi:CRP/FNR family transcriptional regulator, cyclic AMP receptor protein